MGAAGKVRRSGRLTSGQRPRSRARVRRSSPPAVHRLRSLQRHGRRRCGGGGGRGGAARMLGRSCGREPLGTRGPASASVLPRGCGVTGAWPREPTPPWRGWPGGAEVPTVGTHAGVAVVALSLGLAGPEAGGLLASPAFPSSVWLGSWALPDGKPARGVPRRYQSVRGNLRWGSASVPSAGRRGLCLRGCRRIPAPRGLPGWLLEREDRLLEEVIDNGGRRSVKLWAAE